MGDSKSIEALLLTVLLGATGASAASRLDVGVLVLDPEPPKKNYFLSDPEPQSEEVSQSEATFVAVHLVQTLQKSGEFGRVRVIPRESVITDVLVTGAVRRSLGRRLEVAIEVIDATGRRWLRRRYKQKANPFLYARRFRSLHEPFQDLYDRIAADLVVVQGRMGTEHREDLRRVAQLRYAAQLVPAVFDGYLARDRKGRIDLERLPSRDDPMMARVREIQVRDDVFLDLLAERYRGFYHEMNQPYYDYRANRFAVELALRDARAKATLVNAQALWTPDPSALESRRAARELAQYRRMAADQARYLEDISSTFEVVVEPMVVELDGEVVRLTGTIDDQYRQWQQLLASIFATETGLPSIAPTRATLERGSRP